MEDLDQQINKMEQYDSTKDTQEHIDKVAAYLEMAGGILYERGKLHDASKLVSPEKEYFDKYTPDLQHLVFGTPEYKESCMKLKPALDHHFANNSHHPQFYGEEGIGGMNLFDIMEMFFDWKASGERNSTGNIYKSIDINAERFGISKQFRKILINTAKYLGYE